MLKNIIEFLWGLPQNIIGLIMYLYYKAQGCQTEILDGAKITYWGLNRGGCSMGQFLFIPDKTNIREKQVKETMNFIVHEYGHRIQSILTGPFWFLLFGFESIIWYLLWTNTKLNSKLYNSFYPEKNANYFGEKKFNHKGIYW